MTNLEIQFDNWLKDNQKELQLSAGEIKELVSTLDYMIADACIGWEYDYQYDIKIDLNRRIDIINKFDGHLLVGYREDKGI